MGIYVCEYILFFPLYGLGKFILGHIILPSHLYF